MASTRPPADSPEVLALLAEGLKLVPFVVKQARLHLASLVREEDVIACANEGALLAARSFDPSRRVPFSRWATLRMRGAVIDGMRRSGSLPRRVYLRLRALEASLAVEETFAEEDASAPPASPEAADARLDDYLATMATSLAAGVLFSSDAQRLLEEIEDPYASPDERIDTERLRATVRDIVATLPEKERVLVEKHWVDGMTLEEAGASMGLSRSWSCRLHTRAVVRITKALQRRGVSA
jgi:RNA polymerase sigma factor for flagellar operon FliA